LDNQQEEGKHWNTFSDLANKGKYMALKRRATDMKERVAKIAENSKDCMM